ncbi:uncharacterized protein LOC133183542 [Saccostrea echinata]|uniref:uncharacterized protein LOC133183542 n=1 Tax=Saccostrea echinata TaxID=191078 RepID=UPI002A827050|nr:uncharacterized protein LOC133183542 [Saccostrea echinata]
MRAWIILLYSQCIIFINCKDATVSDTVDGNEKEEAERMKSLKFSHPIGRREQGNVLKSKLNTGRRNRLAETLFTRPLGRTKNWKQKESDAIQNNVEIANHSKNVLLTTSRDEGLEELSKNTTGKIYDPPISNVEKDTLSQNFPNINNSRPKRISTNQSLRKPRRNWRKYLAIRRKILKRLRRKNIKIFVKRTNGRI